MRKHPGRILKTIAIVLLSVLLTLGVLPYLVPLSQASPMEGPPPYGNSAWETVNGTPFHYRIFPPAGETAKGKVLLLHGLGGSTFSFEAAAPMIAGEGYLVAAADLPGFGYSGRDPGYDHNQANRAEDVWDLLSVIDQGLDSSLAAEPWHLAGHSMGGGTIAAMALRDESRAKSLIFIDAALFDSPGGGGFTALPPAVRWLQVVMERFLLNERSIGRFLTSAYGRPPSPEEVKGYLTPLTLPGTARAFAGLVRTARNEDAGLLKGIATPILAVWGSGDTWVPFSSTEKLLGIRPDAVIATIESAAHCPMETHPEEFVRIVLEWLSQHGGKAE